MRSAASSRLKMIATQALSRSGMRKVGATLSLLRSSPYSQLCSSIQSRVSTTSLVSGPPACEWPGKWVFGMAVSMKSVLVSWDAMNTLMSACTKVRDARPTSPDAMRPFWGGFRHQPEIGTVDASYAVPQRPT